MTSATGANVADRVLWVTGLQSWIFLSRIGSSRFFGGFTWVAHCINIM